MSYFKFFTLFPEFLDIDEPNEIKLSCLSMLKKQYRGKNYSSSMKLIHYDIFREPTTGNRRNIDEIKINNSYIKERIKDVKYRLLIKFKNKPLFVFFFPEDFIDFKYEPMYKEYNYRKYYSFFNFLSEEELINLKRKIIIQSLK